MKKRMISLLLAILFSLLTPISVYATNDTLNVSDYNITSASALYLFNTETMSEASEEVYEAYYAYAAQNTRGSATGYINDQYNGVIVACRLETGTNILTQKKWAVAVTEGGINYQLIAATVRICTQAQYESGNIYPNLAYDSDGHAYASWAEAETQVNSSLNPYGARSTHSITVNGQSIVFTVVLYDENNNPYVQGGLAVLY